jgi:hypothetical protein
MQGRSSAMLSFHISRNWSLCSKNGRRHGQQSDFISLAFLRVTLFSICPSFYILKITLVSRIMDDGQTPKPGNSECYHLRQNPLASTSYQQCELAWIRKFGISDIFPVTCSRDERHLKVKYIANLVKIGYRGLKEMLM